MWTSESEFPGAAVGNDLSEPIRFDKFDRDEERFQFLFILDRRFRCPASVIGIYVSRPG